MHRTLVLAAAALALLTGGSALGIRAAHHGGTESAAAAAPTGSDPCREAFKAENQQVAAELEPDSAAARRVGAGGAFSSLIGVGTLADAVCFDTSTEFHPKGDAFRLATISVAATGTGYDGEPVTYRLDGTGAADGMSLYVPTGGCVTVDGTVTATPTDGQDERLSWSAHGVFGRACAAYENRSH
jgi:hypothetical protein